jgi:hypothetical protein
MRGLRHKEAVVLPGDRLSRKDAAIYLGRAPQTLAGWAVERRGPKVLKIGARAFYNLVDLDAFIADGMATPVSPQPQPQPQPQPVWNGRRHSPRQPS